MQVRFIYIFQLLLGGSQKLVIRSGATGQPFLSHLALFLSDSMACIHDGGSSVLEVLSTGNNTDSSATDSQAQGSSSYSSR